MSHGRLKSFRLFGRVAVEMTREGSRSPFHSCLGSWESISKV